MNQLPALRQVALRTSRLTGRSLAAGVQVGQTRRMSSEPNPNRPDLEQKKEMVQKLFSQFNHGAYVKHFGFPTFWSTFFRKFFLEYRMKSIDPKFNEELFKSECKEASIIFCNLAGDYKEDQGHSVRELMTEKAYDNLVNLLENASDEELTKLKLNERDIQHFNLLFMQTIAAGGRKYVETTFSILMKPAVFEEGVPLNPSNLDLILIKYLRDYTDGPDSNTDWKISYFDCKFVRPMNFQEFNDIFKL